MKSKPQTLIKNIKLYFVRRWINLLPFDELEATYKSRKTTEYLRLSIAKTAKIVAEMWL